jgi:hypothetical protein
MFSIFQPFLPSVLYSVISLLSVPLICSFLLFCSLLYLFLPFSFTTLTFPSFSFSALLCPSLLFSTQSFPFLSVPLLCPFLLSSSSTLPLTSIQFLFSALFLPFISSTLPFPSFQFLYATLSFLSALSIPLRIPNSFLSNAMNTSLYASICISRVFIYTISATFSPSLFVPCAYSVRSFSPGCLNCACSRVRSHPQDHSVREEARFQGFPSCSSLYLCTWYFAFRTENYFVRASYSWL